MTARFGAQLRARTVDSILKCIYVQYGNRCNFNIKYSYEVSFQITDFTLVYAKKGVDNKIKYIYAM